MRAALDRIQACLNEIQADLKKDREALAEATRLAEDIRGKGIGEIKGQLHQQAGFLSRFAAMSLDLERIAVTLDEIKQLIREVANNTNPG